MLTRIKKSSDDRKKFFQNTSHELKSPLMAIQGYAEAIKDKVVTGEEVEESLNIIIDKSQYLKKVVEKTIYLSKLETDIYSFERVVFNEYIDNYINEYNSFVTANSNIEIVIDNQLSKNIYVMLDIEKFNSVFNNILDNALRYANTLIKVELSFINDMICIKIIDDGEGFKNNEYDKIFNRFYKGEKGQSGIGLAIAHSITTHHKGSIKAYNYIRGGAVFEILLPVIYID
jgi:signal transduction histidine kinase